MEFSTEGYQEKIEKPWGYELIYTPKNMPQAGKILFVRSGQKLSLQYHESKEETLCLFSGQARIWLENSAGAIEKINMEPQCGYSVVSGQRHRIEAMEDSFIIEVSSPEKGKTVRIEDEYSRTDETEEMRAQKNRGWEA